MLVLLRGSWQYLIWVYFNSKNFFRVKLVSLMILLTVPLFNSECNGTVNLIILPSEYFSNLTWEPFCLVAIKRIFSTF